MSSIWKNNLSLSIFGESHGPAIGTTLAGVPAGEHICLDTLQSFLARRAPGSFSWTTPRKETDIPEFLSGVKNGKTTGTSITAIIRNKNTRPADYDVIRDIPRPGHADYSAYVKYGGHADMSGGGHFSGRLTAALCIAGGICKQILNRRGVTIGANIIMIGSAGPDIGGFGFTPEKADPKDLQALAEKDIPVFDDELRSKMIEEIERAKADGDSVGGLIGCISLGVPAGLGDPIFGGMENRVSGLVFGIPAVKGIDFGSGFGFSAMRGSEANDEFFFDGDTVKTRTNCNGGIIGGITTGMPILFRTVIKPTPSIALPQKSIDLRKTQPADLKIQGRHDPCIVPRAVPCVEAAAAIAIFDAMLLP